MGQFRLVTFLICLFIGCNTKDSKPDHAFISEFNDLARDRYFSRKAHEQLDNLKGDSRYCILRETISKYLNDVASPIIDTVDSFFIRDYFQQEVGDHFTFVCDGPDRFHFIYLDRFYDLSNYKFEPSTSLYKLNDSIGFSIFRINSKNLDQFITDEVSSISSERRQVDLLQRIGPYIFPELRNKISRMDFEELLPGKVYPQNLNYVRETIKFLLNGQRTDKVQLYYLNMRGFIISIVQTKQMGFGKSLELYFIPEKNRAYFPVMDGDYERFGNCYVQK